MCRFVFRQAGQSLQAIHKTNRWRERGGYSVGTGMNVLSIDFDYFIDISAEIRNTCFPYAEDTSDEEEVNRRWEQSYRDYPALREIGLINDYGRIQDGLRLIMEEHAPEVLIRESHRELYDAIRERGNRLGRLVNVDFHHDWYCMYGGGEITCANWLRKLEEVFPPIQDMVWVKRADSETECLAGRFPYRMTEDIRAVTEKADYHLVYLCYSPEWTPPHLRVFFERLCAVCGFHSILH